MKRHRQHVLLMLLALSISSAACTSSGWRPTLYPFHSEYESSVAPAAARYTCLTHADVVTSTAGVCPRCGVPLVVKK